MGVTSGPRLGGFLLQHLLCQAPAAEQSRGGVEQSRDAVSLVLLWGGESPRWLKPGGDVQLDESKLSKYRWPLVQLLISSGLGVLYHSL